MLKSPSVDLRGENATVLLYPMAFPWIQHWWNFFNILKAFGPLHPYFITSYSFKMWGFLKTCSQFPHLHTNPWLFVLHRIKSQIWSCSRWIPATLHPYHGESFGAVWRENKNKRSLALIAHSFVTFIDIFLISSAFNYCPAN